MVAVERLNLVKKELADFVNLECHVLSALKVPTVPCGVLLFNFFFPERRRSSTFW